MSEARNFGSARADALELQLNVLTSQCPRDDRCGHADEQRAGGRPADALRGAFGVVRPAVLVRQQRRAAAVGIRVLVAGGDAGRVEHVLHALAENASSPGGSISLSMSKNWSMSRMTWDKYRTEPPVHGAPVHGRRRIHRLLSPSRSQAGVTNRGTGPERRDLRGYRHFRSTGTVRQPVRHLVPVSGSDGTRSVTTSLMPGKACGWSRNGAPWCHSRGGNLWGGL
jgi:hypothetical protein